MCDYHIMFLDFLSNSMSIGAFADHYALEDIEAMKVIRLGRLAHNSQFGSII